MRRYLFSLFIVSFISVLVTLGFYNWILPASQSPGYYIALGMIMMITFISHLWVSRTLQKNVRRFNQVYLLSTVIRMMIILIFLVVYLLLDRSQLIPFVMTTFLLYIVYTVFEVFMLKKELKSLSDNQN